MNKKEGLQREKDREKERERAREKCTKKERVERESREYRERVIENE